MDQQRKRGHDVPGLVSGVAQFGGLRGRVMPLDCPRQAPHHRAPLGAARDQEGNVPPRRSLRTR
jgi:hypothetical protein